MKKTHQAEQEEPDISIVLDQTVESSPAVTATMTDPPTAPVEKTEVVTEVVTAPAEKTEVGKVDASQANFACKDVRLKTWTAQRESIKNLLKFFSKPVHLKQEQRSSQPI